MTAPERIAEVTKKSGLVWVTVGTGRANPTWHLWHGTAAYVLAGGAEQPLRGLDTATRVAVTVRGKPAGEHVLTWVATVHRVEPGSAEWDEAIAELFVKRLNVPDGREAPVRWARESTLLRLDPTGELVEPAGGSGAAPPAGSPATTSGPLPFVLGRRARK